MAQREFQYKQVIAARVDLEMGKGKLAVQVSHAAVSAAETTRKKNPEWFHAWLQEGQCKIAVKVKDLSELLNLKKEVAQMSLPHSLITDRGLTQLPSNTITCLGIGPAPSPKIDRITGLLPLL